VFYSYTGTVHQLGSTSITGLSSTTGLTTTPTYFTGHRVRGFRQDCYLSYSGRDSSSTAVMSQAATALDGD